MSLIFILLLFAFVYFVLMPILRVWFTVRKAKNHVRDFFGGQRRPTSGSQSYSQARTRRPRKKIDPNIGEYVDFEDIPTYTATQATYTEIHYEREEQITDADWEDIK